MVFLGIFFRQPITENGSVYGYLYLLTRGKIAAL